MRQRAMPLFWLAAGMNDCTPLRLWKTLHDRCLREAIEDYGLAKAEHPEFRSALQRAMEENVQLIAELARY